MIGRRVGRPSAATRRARTGRCRSARDDADVVVGDERERAAAGGSPESSTIVPVSAIASAEPVTTASSVSRSAIERSSSMTVPRSAKPGRDADPLGAGEDLADRGRRRPSTRCTVRAVLGDALAEQVDDARRWGALPASAVLARDRRARRRGAERARGRGRGCRPWRCSRAARRRRRRHASESSRAGRGRGASTSRGRSPWAAPGGRASRSSPGSAAFASGPRPSRARRCAAS